VLILHLDDANPNIHLLELNSGQGLSEDDSQLIVRSNELHFNSPFTCTFSNKVVSYMDVLASPMMNQVSD
jgi:hypothetical protein